MSIAIFFPLLDRFLKRIAHHNSLDARVVDLLPHPVIRQGQLNRGRSDGMDPGGG